MKSEIFFDEKILKYTSIHLKKVIPESELIKIYYSIYNYWEDFISGMVIETERWFLQETVKTHILDTIRVPETWWDMWKEQHPRIIRWFPSSWCRIHHRIVETKVINLQFNYQKPGIILTPEEKAHGLKVLYDLVEEYKL